MALLLLTFCLSTNFMAQFTNTSLYDYLSACCSRRLIEAEPRITYCDILALVCATRVAASICIQRSIFRQLFGLLGPSYGSLEFIYRAWFRPCMGLRWLRVQLLWYGRLTVHWDPLALDIEVASCAACSGCLDREVYGITLDQCSTSMYGSVSAEVRFVRSVLCFEGMVRARVCFVRHFEPCFVQDCQSLPYICAALCASVKPQN